MSFTYDWPRPAVTVDICLFNISHPKSILLIKRKNEPYKEKWALPGGFLDEHETSIEAAVRELAEETSIVLPPKRLELAAIGDSVNRDPRQRTISIVYMATGYNFIDEWKAAQAGDDAMDLCWCRVEEDVLDSNTIMAFDHKEIIQKVWEKIVL